MIARTLPFKSHDKPDEQLPSIAEEINSLSTLSSK
jgi:hypothetical protein